MELLTKWMILFLSFTYTITPPLPSIFSFPPVCRLLKVNMLLLLQKKKKKVNRKWRRKLILQKHFSYPAVLKEFSVMMITWLSITQTLTLTHTHDEHKAKETNGKWKSQILLHCRRLYTCMSRLKKPKRKAKQNWCLDDNDEIALQLEIKSWVKANRRQNTKLLKENFETNLKKRGKQLFQYQSSIKKINKKTITCQHKKKGNYKDIKRV